MSRARLVVLVVAAACGDDEHLPAPDAPAADAPPSQSINDPGLSAPVTVIRDRYGIPHIQAQTLPDAAFAHGYLAANDRLLQMEIDRFNSRGELARYGGALVPGTIISDIVVRMRRLGPRAEAGLAELTATTDPADQRLVAYMTRYCDGVNKVRGEVTAGTRTFDPAIGAFLDTTVPNSPDWTPLDLVVMNLADGYGGGYFEEDLFRTDVRQRLVATFDEASVGTDPDLARRAGISHDFVSVKALDPVATIDGFPNLAADSGTRAKPSRRLWNPAPRVPDAVLRPALDLFRTGYPRHSNNWVVGPALAGGKTLLASDPHGDLPNPNRFWYSHITVPGELDVAGGAFGARFTNIIGHNGHVAWGVTTSVYDVTDFYAETIVPCTAGGGDCVLFQGGEVAIETFTETIEIGALGLPIDSLEVTYEEVPHHGPILPIIDFENQVVIPRTEATAVSVRFAGAGEPSQDLRARFGLHFAGSVQEAFTALDAFEQGSYNFVLADDAGSIGWTTTERVPLRSAGCFTFDADTAPDGVRPDQIVPGDGSCEWEGWMDARYLPHAINPAAGYLATANADPIGATFDGDPFNEPMAGGHLLYVGSIFEPGFRIGRIRRVIDEQAAAGPITLDGMAALQTDTRANFSALVLPALLAFLEDLEEEIATPGTHLDISAWTAGLDAARRARLAATHAFLADWDLGAGVDSAGITIFHAWMSELLGMVLGDEAGRAGLPGFDGARIGAALLLRPEELRSGIAAETGQPILCDDLNSVEIESCRLMALIALDRRLEWLASPTGFGTAVMEEWRWGRWHRLVLDFPAPSEALLIPPPNDPDPELRGGYATPGDFSTVNQGGFGFGFRQEHGPDMRFLVELAAGQPPRSRLALAGGVIFDPRSPHYRDLMDQYWTRQTYFDVPFTTEAISAAEESRLRFEPGP